MYSKLVCARRSAAYDRNLKVEAKETFIMLTSLKVSLRLSKIIQKLLNAFAFAIALFLHQYAYILPVYYFRKLRADMVRK